ncbi:hypothetical protein [Paenibacillus sp. MAEPY2]|nr:hypothetical protein [Paenibacillus sp. MAEPY2]
MNLLTDNPSVLLDQVALLMGHFKETGDPNILQKTIIYTTPGFKDFTVAVESTSWTSCSGSWKRLRPTLTFK